MLTLPDPSVTPDPCWVSDDEYRQLVIYLTSVPVLEEADQGFILVIDRRQDRWSSVKAALLHIAVSTSELRIRVWCSCWMEKCSYVETMRRLAR